MHKRGKGKEMITIKIERNVEEFKKEKKSLEMHIVQQTRPFVTDKYQLYERTEIILSL